VIPDEEPRSTLRPEDYVAAAVRFVDEHGFSALTMRSLGEALGVDPTAVYRHFVNKDALIAGVLDAVIKEILTEAPEEIEDPVQWLKDIAWVARRVFEGHPTIAGAVLSGSGGLPHLVLTSAKIVKALEMIGLEGDHLVVCYQALEGFVLGSVVFDLLGAPYHLEIRRQRHRLLDHSAFDDLTRTEAEVQDFSWRAFEFGVNTLVDGFVALARKSDS
jgi:AcrR family transcriptional regulator